MWPPQITKIVSETTVHIFLHRSAYITDCTADGELSVIMEACLVWSFSNFFHNTVLPFGEVWIKLTSVKVQAHSDSVLHVYISVPTGKVVMGSNGSVVVSRENSLQEIQYESL
jgi:hypothetical protein